MNKTWSWILLGALIITLVNDIIIAAFGNQISNVTAICSAIVAILLQLTVMNKD